METGGKQIYTNHNVSMYWRMLGPVLCLFIWPGHDVWESGLQVTDPWIVERQKEKQDHILLPSLGLVHFHILAVGAVKWPAPVSYRTTVIPMLSSVVNM